MTKSLFFLFFFNFLNLYNCSNEYYSGSESDNESGSSSEIISGSGSNVESGYEEEINLPYMNENQLRRFLFQNYSVNSIPVIDVNDNILLKYGIQIESLEYFNQVSENIKFNTLIIQEWTDNLLKWDYLNHNHNNRRHNFDYITLLSYQVWNPDLELYNAAEKPVIFDIKGGLKLYNNGTIFYNRPTKYSFSCKLDLRYFPFDTQHCTMTFGSWKYSKKKLDLIPFNSSDKIKNISISEDFSHNEWNIINVNVSHEDIVYLCCPNDYYPNSVFTISLKRNPHKYMIVIIMTIFITISDFFVTFIRVDNYKRTFILVFIPLTLLWLQIYIASKIPVIEYPTLMEKVLLSCFIITILNAFESGILYILIIKSRPKKIPFIKTIYDDEFKKMNIISFFEKKYYDLTISNNIIYYIHNFDNLYRFVIIIFFTIYTSILIN